LRSTSSARLTERVACLRGGLTEVADIVPGFPSDG
jgi:hypothetical protein